MRTPGETHRRLASKWFLVPMVLAAVLVAAGCGSEEGDLARDFGLAPGEDTGAKAIGWLEDPDPKRRSVALVILAGQPEKARAAWPKLRALLDDEDAEVRRLALALLPRIREQDTDLRDELLHRLQNDHPAKAQEAALGLLLGEYELASALSTLMAELRRESETPHRDYVRRIVADLVGRIGPAASGEIPVLLELMENEPALTSTIARALPSVVGEDDPHRDAVLEALRRAWSSEDPAVRDAANDAYDLIRYGPEDEEPARDE